MQVRRIAALLCCCCIAGNSSAQMLIDGRIAVSKWPGATDKIYLPAIYCFANAEGSARQGQSFRTWETEPAGWFRFSGPPGNYAMLFSQPAYFMRPVVVNNIFTLDGERVIGLPVVPEFDFHSFSEKEWDPKPAMAYYQTFVAKGTSVTAVGFKLATDGVDGFGPKSQNLLVSIHRKAAGTPDEWPQIGPTMLVPDVDCGGAKNYTWSAGWNSGEAPLEAGETYGICLRAEVQGNTFQAFWRPVDEKEPRCYRVSSTSHAFEPRQIWMGVSTDNDGLLIPYNKRVQKQFGRFAGFSRRWSQTYVAQGRSLAGVILYAAVGGAQPPLNRQRVAVRLRRGGPEGERVGVEKIAVGNGNYTGDASWGVFGCSFAPGEAPVLPGETYAIEFESVENFETLHGFVNIKKQVSDDRAGFNPYRKHAQDDYALGTSFKSGEKQDFDLDMQIMEYQRVATNMAFATDGKNLLSNGDFTQGAIDADVLPQARPPKQPLPATSGDVSGWTKFSASASTRHSRILDAETTNGFARVFGLGKEPIDGGFVQRLDGLSRFETYRLRGRVRSSWATEMDRSASVGIDKTGQTDDPKSPTIMWTNLTGVHGVWESFVSEPIRPATNAISIWLRARGHGEDLFPLKIDFDDFACERVRTSVFGL